MARPQNSFKGLFAKSRVDIGSQNLTYNSTALILSGGVRISDKAGGQLTANSTAVILPGGVKISNKSTGQLTANSTGVVFSIHQVIGSTGSETAAALSFFSRYQRLM